jgi:hypothetical protein
LRCLVLGGRLRRAANGHTGLGDGWGGSGGRDGGRGFRERRWRHMAGLLDGCCYGVDCTMAMTMGSREGCGDPSFGRALA